jgi:cytosine/uracil/thiamine/allantoin permease
MRKALTTGPLSGLEWLAATCFGATILVWAVIDLSTETQLQWITETAFLPVVGLLIPLAGLITGSIVSLKGRGSIKPASLMGASSPLVATVGFVIGLAIAMGRFEAVVYTGP